MRGISNPAIACVQNSTELLKIYPDTSNKWNMSQDIFCFDSVWNRSVISFYQGNIVFRATIHLRINLRRKRHQQNIVGMLILKSFGETVLWTIFSYYHSLCRKQCLRMDSYDFAWLHKFLFFHFSSRLVLNLVWFGRIYLALPV